MMVNKSIRSTRSSKGLLCVALLLLSGCSGVPNIRFADSDAAVEDNTEEDKDGGGPPEGKGPPEDRDR